MTSTEAPPMTRIEEYTRTVHDLRVAREKMRVWADRMTAIAGVLADGTPDALGKHFLSGAVGDYPTWQEIQRAVTQFQDACVRVESLFEHMSLGERAIVEPIRRSLYLATRSDPPEGSNQ